MHDGDDDDDDDNDDDDHHHHHDQANTLAAKIKIYFQDELWSAREIGGAEVCFERYYVGRPFDPWASEPMPACPRSFTNDM
eukprot:5017452-Amphidinium_carterae.1